MTRRLLRTLLTAYKAERSSTPSPTRAGGYAAVMLYDVIEPAEPETPPGHCVGEEVWGAYAENRGRREQSHRNFKEDFSDS